MGGSWVFLQASTRQICPCTAPLSPYQHPRALIPYRYPGPILWISWAYIDHIFALYIGPVTFSKHFQHTLTISSPHLHNILTAPPKQLCGVMSIHAYTRLPSLVQLFLLPLSIALHWSDFTRVLKVSYFKPFIVIPIYLPALKHLKIPRIFFMNRIALPKYCFSIAQVIIISFTKLVFIYYPK